MKKIKYLHRYWQSVRAVFPLDVKGVKTCILDRLAQVINGADDLTSNDTLVIVVNWKFKEIV